MVTHPQAQGIARFEKEFLGFLKEQKFEVRNHLGKNFPAGVVRYAQFLDSKNLKQFIEAAERLAMAPYNMNYFQEMLDLSPSLESELEIKSIKVESHSPKSKSMEYTKDEYVAFLTRLYAAVDLMPVQSEAAKKAKGTFLKTCQSELEHRKVRDLVIA